MPFANYVLWMTGISTQDWIGNSQIFALSLALFIAYLLPSQRFITNKAIRLRMDILFGAVFSAAFLYMHYLLFGFQTPNSFTLFFIVFAVILLGISLYTHRLALCISTLFFMLIAELLFAFFILLGVAAAH